MQYKVLDKTGFKVSRVGYGGIVSAMQDFAGYTYPGDQQECSDRYVNWALDQGINYFDVAPTYGNAQLRLGNSLIGHRDEIYLACKTMKRDYDSAKQEMEKSLELLHTDHFDTYQMHELKSMEDIEIAASENGIFKLFDEMKQQGITKKVGFTAHSEEVVLRAVDMYDVDSVLFPYNWHMNMAHDMGSRIIKKCREKNIDVICMKSMVERAWTDDIADDVRVHAKYPKSWCRPFEVEKDEEILVAALKYVIGLGVDVILPPGNFDHFKFAVEHIDEVLTVPMTEREKELLNTRLEEVRPYPFFNV